MQEDGTDPRPVGFGRFHNVESFREADKTFSSSSNTTINIPKRRSPTPEVLEEVNKLSRNNPDREIDVVLGKNFHRGVNNEWDSQITIDGETYKSQAGVYNYDYAQSLAQDMDGIVGSQFVLNDKAFSKSVLEFTPLKNVSFIYEQQNPISKAISHGLSNTVLWFSDTVPKTLRGKEADILLNKFQFSEGRNPNEEVIKWHRYRAKGKASEKDFNFELYNVQEPKSDGKDPLRLHHSKYLAGKIGEEKVSFDYTAPMADFKVFGNVVGPSSTFFDLYYTSYHPKIYQEKKEYHQKLKKSNETGELTSYSGDYVIGGGNTILKRVIEDFRKAEGKVSIASPSFVMEEGGFRDSIRDDKAKDLMNTLVSVIEGKGSDASLVFGRVGPRSDQDGKELSNSEKIARDLESEGVYVGKPNYEYTDGKALHFNLYMAEDIDEEGTDVFYLTTRRMVGESHGESAIRITTKEDPKSYRRIKSIFEGIKGNDGSEWFRTEELLSELSKRENVSVEILKKSSRHGYSISEGDISGSTDKYKSRYEDVEHPSVELIPTYRRQPKFNFTSAEREYQTVRPLTKLPSSFYSRFREAPKLPEINLYRDPDINEDLNRMPFKEYLNRFIKHDLSINLRSPAFEPDETFLEGTASTLGYFLDEITGHYAYQQHKLRVQGYYSKTPYAANRAYYEGNELSTGPFEKILEGVTKTVSAMSASLISYGLFRGTSLLSSYMEDELNRQLMRTSGSGKGMGVVKSFYLGFGDLPKNTSIRSDQIPSRISFAKYQGIFRKIQGTISDTVVGGILETISASDQDKKEIRRAVSFLSGEVSKPPIIHADKDSIRVSNIGSERVRSIAEQWEKVSQKVPANFMYWFPHFRQGSGVDFSKRGSLSDLVGQNLQDVLITHEQIFLRLGKLFANPLDTTSQIANIYRQSNLVNKADKGLLYAMLKEGETNLLEFSTIEKLSERSQQKVDLEGQINRYQADIQLPNEGAANLRNNRDKKAFGIPVRTLRKSILTTTAIFGADYLTSFVLTDQGGLNLIHSLWSEEARKAREISSDLPFYMPLTGGAVGALVGGWSFPEIFSDRPLPISSSISEENYIARKETLSAQQTANSQSVAQRTNREDELYKELRRRKRQAKVGSVREQALDRLIRDRYYLDSAKRTSTNFGGNSLDDIKKLAETVRYTKRARFNMVAAGIGFATVSSGMRLLSGGIASILNSRKEGGFPTQSLSYIASQRINSYDSEKNLTREEEAYQIVSESYKSKLLKTSDNTFKTTESVAGQIATPIFQIAMVQETSPQSGVQSYRLGWQFFPLLGGGMTPTIPLGFKLFSRPEANRGDLSSDWFSDEDSKGNWKSMLYRVLTFPSEFVTRVENSDYENLLMTVGTYGVAESILGRVTPKSLKDSFLGKSAKGVSRTITDFGSSVLAAPSFMTDPFKRGVEEVLDELPDKHLLKKVRKTYKGAFELGQSQSRSSFWRRAAPFALAYIASSAYLDQNQGIFSNEYQGYTNIEENKVRRVTATLGLTALYGSSLQGSIFSHNVFSESRVIAQDLANKGYTIEPNQVLDTQNRGLSRTVRGVNLDPTVDNQRPRGSDYTSRKVGRYLSGSIRVAAIYWAGQIAGGILNDLGLSKHIFKYGSHKEGGFFRNVQRGVRDTFQIYLGGYSRPDFASQAYADPYVKEVMNSYRPTGVKSVLGKLWNTINPLGWLEESGAYTDDPNMFINWAVVGSTFRDSSGELSSDSYVQFQGSNIDLSYTVRSLSQGKLSKTESQIIDRLLIGDSKLNPRQVINRIRSLPPRTKAMQSTSIRSSEVAQVSSKTLGRALAVRQFYSEHLNWKRPEVLALEHKLNMTIIGLDEDSKEDSLFAKYLPSFSSVNLKFGEDFYSYEEGFKSRYEKFIDSKDQGSYTKVEGMFESMLNFIRLPGQIGGDKYTFGFSSLISSGDKDLNVPAAMAYVGFRALIVASGFYTAGMLGGTLLASSLSAWESATQQDTNRRIEGMAQKVERVNVANSQKPRYHSYTSDNSRSFYQIFLEEKDKAVVVPGLKQVEEGYAQKATARFSQLYKSEFIPRFVDELGGSAFVTTRYSNNLPSISKVMERHYANYLSSDLKIEDLRTQIRPLLEEYKERITNRFIDLLEGEISIGYDHSSSTTKTTTLYEALTGDTLESGKVRSRLENIFGNPRTGSTLEDQIIEVLEQAKDKNMSSALAMDHVRLELSTRLYNGLTPFMSSQVLDESMGQAFIEREANLTAAIESRHDINRSRGRTLSSRTAGDFSPRDIPKVLSYGSNLLGYGIFGQETYGLLEGASLYADSDSGYYSKKASQDLFFREATMLGAEYGLTTLFTRAGFSLVPSLALMATAIGGYHLLRSRSDQVQKVERSIGNFSEDYLSFIPWGLGKAINLFAESPSILPGVRNDFNLFQDITSPWLLKQHNQLRDKNNFQKIIGSFFLPNTASLLRNGMGSQSKETVWGRAPHFYGDPMFTWKYKQEQRRRRTAQHDRPLSIIHPGLMGIPTTSRGRDIRSKYFKGSRVQDAFSFSRNYPISGTLRLALERRQRMSDLYADGYIYRLNNVEDNSWVSQRVIPTLAKAQQISSRLGRGFFFSSSLRDLNEFRKNIITQPAYNLMDEVYKSAKKIDSISVDDNTKLGSLFNRGTSKVGYFLQSRTPENLEDVIPSTLEALNNNLKRVGNPILEGTPQPIKNISKSLSDLFGHKASILQATPELEPLLYQARKANTIERFFGKRKELAKSLHSLDSLYASFMDEDIGMGRAASKLSGTGIRGLFNKGRFLTRFSFDFISSLSSSFFQESKNKASRWTSVGVFGAGNLTGRFLSWATVGIIDTLGIVSSFISKPFRGASSYLPDINEEPIIRSKHIQDLIGQDTLNISPTDIQSRYNLKNYWEEVGRIPKWKDTSLMSESSAREIDHEWRLKQESRLRAQSRNPLNKARKAIGIGSIAKGTLKGIGSIAKGTLKGIGSIAKGIGSIAKGIGSIAKGTLKGIGNRAKGIGSIAKGTLKGFGAIAPDILSFGLDYHFISKANERIENLNRNYHYEAHYKQAYGEFYSNLGGAVFGAVGLAAITVATGGLPLLLALGIGIGLSVTGSVAGGMYGRGKGEAIYRGDSEAPLSAFLGGILEESVYRETKDTRDRDFGIGLGLIGLATGVDFYARFRRHQKNRSTGEIGEGGESSEEPSQGKYNSRSPSDPDNSRSPSDPDNIRVYRDGSSSSQQTSDLSSRPADQQSRPLSNTLSSQLVDLQGRPLSTDYTQISNLIDSQGRLLSTDYTQTSDLSSKKPTSHITSTNRNLSPKERLYQSIDPIQNLQKKFSNRYDPNLPKQKTRLSRTNQGFRTISRKIETKVNRVLSSLNETDSSTSIHSVYNQTAMELDDLKGHLVSMYDHAPDEDKPFIQDAIKTVDKQIESLGYEEYHVEVSVESDLDHSLGIQTVEADTVDKSLRGSRSVIEIRHGVRGTEKNPFSIERGNILKPVEIYLESPRSAPNQPVISDKPITSEDSSRSLAPEPTSSDQPVTSNLYPQRSTSTFTPTDSQVTSQHTPQDSPITSNASSRNSQPRFEQPKLEEYSRQAKTLENIFPLDRPDSSMRLEGLLTDYFEDKSSLGIEINLFGDVTEQYEQYGIRRHRLSGFSNLKGNISRGLRKAGSSILGRSGRVFRYSYNKSNQAISGVRNKASNLFRRFRQGTQNTLDLVQRETTRLGRGVKDTGDRFNRFSSNISQRVKYQGSRLSRGIKEQTQKIPKPISQGGETTERVSPRVTDSTSTGSGRLIRNVSRGADALGIVADVVDVAIAGYGLYEYQKGVEERDHRRSVRGGQIAGGAISGGVAGTLAGIATGAAIATLGAPVVLGIGIAIGVSVIVGGIASYYGAKQGGRIAKESYKNTVQQERLENRRNYRRKIKESESKATSSIQSGKTNNANAKYTDREKIHTLEVNPKGVDLNMMYGWDRERDAYEDPEAIAYITGPTFNAWVGKIGSDYEMMADVKFGDKVKRTKNRAASKERAFIGITEEGEVEFGYGALTKKREEKYEYFVGGLHSLFNKTQEKPNDYQGVYYTEKTPKNASQWKQKVRYQGYAKRIGYGLTKDNELIFLKTKDSVTPDWLKSKAKDLNLKALYLPDHGTKSRLIIPREKKHKKDLGLLGLGRSAPVPYLLRISQNVEGKTEEDFISYLRDSLEIKTGKDIDLDNSLGMVRKLKPKTESKKSKFSLLSLTQSLARSVRYYFNSFSFGLSTDYESLEVKGMGFSSKQSKDRERSRNLKALINRILKSREPIDRSLIGEPSKSDRAIGLEREKDLKESRPSLLDRARQFLQDSLEFIRGIGQRAIDFAKRLGRGIRDTVGNAINSVKSKFSGAKPYKEGQRVYWDKGRGGSLSSKAANTLTGIAEELNMKPKELLGIMLHESAWTMDTKVTNSIGATGLIQWIPSTRRRMGLSRRELLNMSQSEQMHLAKRYLLEAGYDPDKHGWREAYRAIHSGSPSGGGADIVSGNTTTQIIEGISKNEIPYAESILRRFNRKGSYEVEPNRPSKELTSQGSKRSISFYQKALNEAKLGRKHRVTDSYGVRSSHPVTGRLSFHHGVDIASPSGTNFHNPFEKAKVISSGRVGGYGNSVLIEEMNNGEGTGRLLRVSHLSSREVSKGEVISGGISLGEQGSSGRVTGPHFDIEERVRQDNGRLKSVAPDSNLIIAGITGDPIQRESESRSGYPTNAESIASKYGLSFVSIYDRSGEQVSSYNSDRTPSHAASLIKMVAADVALEAVKQGELSLDSKISVDKILYREHPGYESLTLRQALDKSLSESSNVAFNALVKALGGIGEDSSLNKAIESLGYDNTTITNYLADGYRDKPNQLSPNDASRAMVRLSNRQGKGSDLVRGYLQESSNSDLVPGSVEIMSKWGRTSKVASQTFLLENGMVATVGVNTENYDQSLKAFKNEIYNAIKGLNEIEADTNKADKVSQSVSSQEKANNIKVDTTSNVSFNLNPNPKVTPYQQARFDEEVEKLEKLANLQLELAESSPNLPTKIEPNYSEVQDDESDQVIGTSDIRNRTPRKPVNFIVTTKEETGTKQVEVELGEDEESVQLSYSNSENLNFSDPTEDEIDSLVMLR